MTSVGDISLDLVVQGSITEQLNKLASEAKMPAEKAGESLGKTVADGLEKVKLSVPEFDMPEIGTSAFEAMDKASERIEAKADILREKLY